MSREAATVWIQVRDEHVPGCELHELAASPEAARVVDRAGLFVIPGLGTLHLRLKSTPG